MLEKVKNILNFSERYYVLLISKTSDNAEYQLIEILLKGSELKIEKRLYSNSIEGVFKENLNTNYPLILHIEGENIINKCVIKKPGYRKKIIFKADPEEFHFFEYNQDETVFISVARKHNIDVITKQLSDIQFFVVHLSFGPFIMANIIPIAHGYDTISSPNYSILIENNKILSFNNNRVLQKEYNINGEILNQRELPLLAVFLDFKYPNPNIEFERGFLTPNKTEIIFKKWLKIAGIFTLAFFLLTLPLSHLLLGYYMDSLAEKESQNIISQQTIIQVNALDVEKKLKEKIMFSSGMNQKSFLTKYVVDIGNTVPEFVVLNSINIIPSLKKIKESEKIEFDISTINIDGACQNNKAFNAWLKQLEGLTWIKKIDIEDYSQETRIDNTFTVSIHI